MKPRHPSDPHRPSRQWLLEDYCGYKITPEIYDAIVEHAKKQYKITTTAVGDIIGGTDRHIAIRARESGNKKRPYAAIVRQCLDGYQKLGEEKGWDVLEFIKEHTNKSAVTHRRKGKHTVFGNRVILHNGGDSVEIFFDPGDDLHLDIVEKGFKVRVLPHSPRW